MLLVLVHIFVHEVEQVVAVRLGWISQIDDRYIIAIVLLCDVAVVTIEVTLGICCEKRHSGCTGVFQVWIQPECCLTTTCSTNHKRMHIVIINHCIVHAFLFLDAKNNPLGKFQLTFLRLLAPHLRLIRNILVCLAQLTSISKASRTMLTVTDRLALNFIEVIDMGNDGYATDDSKHTCSN